MIKLLPSSCCRANSCPAAVTTTVPVAFAPVNGAVPVAAMLRSIRPNDAESKSGWIVTPPGQRIGVPPSSTVICNGFRCDDVNVMSDVPALLAVTVAVFPVVTAGGTEATDGSDETREEPGPNDRNVSVAVWPTVRYAAFMAMKPSPLTV